SLSMYLKVHPSQGGRIVAVCDEDLIGPVLEGNGVLMVLDKYRSIYAGEHAGEKEGGGALGRFSSANIVGKESVGLALAMGLAGKGDVMYIKKIPYIQIYRI